jgi:pre-mRNA-splicing factor ATP-dependent RNA helicase DHX15/PRP43
LSDSGFLAPDRTLQPHGRVAKALDISPAWAHALIIASECHCLPEMTILAAFGTAYKSVFLRPRSHQQVAALARQQFAHPESDHIGQLNVFYAFSAFLAEGNRTPNNIKKVFALRLDLFCCHF